MYFSPDFINCVVIVIFFHVSAARAVSYSKEKWSIPQKLFTQLDWGRGI